MAAHSRRHCRPRVAPLLQYLAIIAVASAATEFDDIVAQVNNANTTWTAEVPTRFGEHILLSSPGYHSRI